VSQFPHQASPEVTAGIPQHAVVAAAKSKIISLGVEGAERLPDQGRVLEHQSAVGAAPPSDLRLFVEID
jgi:hypothetical protein